MGRRLLVRPESLLLWIERAEAGSISGQKR
jgi:hypothetical protein